MRFKVIFTDGTELLTDAFTPEQAAQIAVNSFGVRAEASDADRRIVAQVYYEVEAGVWSNEVDASPFGRWLGSISSAEESEILPRFLIYEGRQLPPPKLYKYQAPSDRAFENLESATLWFADPTTFNDPFDCALDVMGLDIPASALDQMVSTCLRFMPEERAAEIRGDPTASAH